jgi:hypothetical protein
MPERIQTRISMPPLLSSGGMPGRRIGFKGSETGVSWGDAIVIGARALKAANMPVVIKKLRRSIQI